MRRSPRTKPVGPQDEDIASSVQKLWLSAIATLWSELGYLPNFRELARSVGARSTYGAVEMLRRLRRKGFVDYRDGLPRTITLTALGMEQLL